MKKTRCLVEFWGEPSNLMMRKRVLVQADGGFLLWVVKCKKIYLAFSDCAVFLCYRRVWYRAVIHSYGLHGECYVTIEHTTDSSIARDRFLRGGVK